MLTVGDKAPEFSRTAHDGGTVDLAALRGRWVVVYFYPADDTPGCTAEACSFRDGYEDFVEAGATVIGISKDSEESHVKFAAKHKLPFQLLSDGDGSLAKAFGVKKTLGFLPGRTTYVIDPEGVVRKVFSSQVRVSKHHTEALATIRGAATPA
jgi:thioredoxin-dependent peroxiredoxin